MANLLSLRKADLAYGAHTVVHGVSIDVPHGSQIGIIGESGSGKTTIARALLGLVAPAKGEVLFEDEPIGSLNAQRRRHYRGAIQPVFQDGTAAFNPKMRVQRILAEGMELAKRNGRPPQSGEELLNAVGLNGSHLRRRAAELSGGQRQRVGIARALATQARALILDEPTSALDVTVQARILDLLEKIVQERDLTIVLISHNLAVVERLCTSAVVLCQGRIVESGTTGELLSNPQHEYTEKLIAAVPRLNLDKE